MPRPIVERLQVMAFLNKGLEINFADERPGREQKVGFRYTGGIVDYVKHLNSTKEPLFKKVCSFAQAEAGSAGRDRPPVEHGVPRVDLLVRERHLDSRRRHARRRVQEGAHQRREPLRAGKGSSEGEGRQPPR